MLTQQKTPWSVIGDFHGDRKIQTVIRARAQPGS
jgi:hypothetical protein